jgi:beta-lactamase regulating signal transducer with metallopeptidase domain
MTSVLHLLTSPAAVAVRALPLLADAAIKGLVIFGAAAVAVAFCRRRSAATRHAIWAGAVAAQLALPVLSGLLPAWRVPIVERLDRRFSARLVPLDEPVDVVVTVAPGDAVPGDAVAAEAPPMPEPVVITESAPSADFAPAIAARAQARAEAAIARAEARMARAEARMARAQARAEARAARAGAAAGSFGAGGSFAGAGGFGGTYVVRQASPSLLTRLNLAVRGMGARSWLRAVGIVWLLGALAILARFVAGTLAVSRLARRSERVDDGRWLSLTQRIAMRVGVARPMTLLRSARFDVPVTWGIVYPVVLLPDDADEWSDERRRYVLVHEMAHVKRVDAFTQLVAQLTLAAFWFNPFVWLAAHRMRVEREHACDDYVLREGTPASTYAADLLAMVRSLGTTGRAQPAFAALAMARPDELETRMQAILDPAQDRASLSSRSTLGLAFCSMLLLVPLAAFRPFSGHQADSFGGEMPDMVALSTAGMPAMAAIPAIPAIPPIPAIPAIPPIPAIPLMPAHLADDLRSAAHAMEATRASLAEVAARASTVAADVAPVAAARVATWSRRGESCSSVSLNRSGTSTSIHSSDDSDDTSFQYISSSAGRCLQVALWGKVEFSDDERDVQSISRDGRLYVRERRPNADRELTVTPGDGGGPRYAYSVDGERASFDDEGRAWLADLLPTVLRESGLNARQRVARIRREGGVSAVLADIKRTQSTSAKRAAYDALLQEGTLSSDEEARVARQAGTDLASSDGELRAVLEAIGKRGHMAAPMAEAFGAAVEHMSSDGEKRELLQQYALKGDRDMLLVSMRQASSISSDGEKSEFLRATASRYLGNDDEQLRNAFFSVTNTISSDGEKHEVLNAVLPYVQKPAILFAVLDAARQISSDGEKSELLVSILHKRVAMTPQLREAFMKTTRTLSSDAEYRRVMEAMLES